jgi:hypothetical protein
LAPTTRATFARLQNLMVTLYNDVPARIQAKSRRSEDQIADKAVPRITTELTWILQLGYQGSFLIDAHRRTPTSLWPITFPYDLDFSV